MARARRETIPEEVKKAAGEIVDAFNKSFIKDPTRYYRTRYRGRFLYLDRLYYGIWGPVCRLEYAGRMDEWDFAIYKYSDERYDPDEWLFPGSGQVDGTIEGAMKAGLEA